MLQTITWTGSAARLIDQTKLPTQTVYIDITDEKQMWDAIKRLVVRGAPAIGVSAAFGAYLGIRSAPGDADAVRQKLTDVCAYLATSRPTAVNLFWALDRVKRVGLQPNLSSAEQIKQAVLDEAIKMLDEDNTINRAIGQHGLDLLLITLGPREEYRLLTHCNAGGLATVQYGTALAPIYYGAERGIRFHVYADETRPLLQGARITAFELKSNGIPVTVICDNMAATVMSQGKIDAVIVGTDRVAANGDVANKIGTHGVAILAKHFNIPFFVACPTSTLDINVPTGKQIPIEERDGKEISHGFNKQTVADGTNIYNPAFDVTPAELVTAIITERGALRAPYTESIRTVLAKQSAGEI
jgi:methylthioribose-1-phosphate isomerase